MEITNANPSEQFAYLVERLIKVIRYENGYAYRLLKKATLDKSAVIELDAIQLTLEARSTEENEYFLAIKIEGEMAQPVFKTTSSALKRIVAGVVTIDKAIAENELYVQGKFSEILDIYQLAICLLTDGPLNPNLRKLWEEFCATWHPAESSIRLQSIENQIPKYNIFVSAIPNSILNIGLG